MANRFVGRILSGAVAVAGLMALPATLSAQTAAVPTFTKDVAPIFQNKCESCHRPDSIAPMSLQTYEEARPWARSIRDRVASRNMPPWHIDPGVGIQHYQNDRSLTQKEIDTIVKWAGNGAPRATPRTCPRRYVGPPATTGTTPRSSADRPTSSSSRRNTTRRPPRWTRGTSPSPRCR